MTLRPAASLTAAASLLLLALAAEDCAGEAAETYEWRRVAIGGGGFITGHDTDPGGTTRVVRADVYGAYLWLDEEDRWAQIFTSANMPDHVRRQDGMNDGAYEIVVAPSRPRRIYLAAKGRVLRSDDRGASFVDVSPLPSGLVMDANSEFRHYGPFMAVAPDDPDLVLIGTPEQGVWRSGDAGKTWTAAATVPPSKDLRPSPGTQSPGAVIWFESTGRKATGRIWAASPGHGVYVSDDRGMTFVPLVTGGEQPTSLTQGGFASDGTFFGVDWDSRSAWRFRDRVWTKLSDRAGLPASRFAAVAIQQSTGHVYVIDEGGKTFRSRDGGESWSKLFHRSEAGRGDPPWLRVSNQSYFAISRVYFDPVLPNRLWAGAGMGVFHADVSESGQWINWVSRTRGIEELVANDVIHVPGQSPLFAALDFGVHLKDDLGAYSTTYGPKERVVIAAQQIAWSPADPRFVATNASDTRTMCCSEDGNAVMAGYSLDAGRTWTKFATLPQPPGTDANDPWRMSFGMIAVSTGSIDNIIWNPSFNRSPFYTKDRGRTWKRVVLEGEQLPLTGTHGYLYSQRKTLTADRVAPSTFYLAHSGGGANEALKGLWRTQDGGESWRRLYGGEIAPASQHAAKLRAVPGHEGHLFFTSAVTGVPDTRLRRSLDGGSSWTVLPDVDRVDDVAFGKAMASGTYPTIYISGQVGGRYGIWRSTDEARTWKRVGGFPVGTLDQVTVIEGDKDRFGRVYIGYKGSGWIWGEPRDCEASPYRFPNTAECWAVD